jgi:hypothetical protein
MMKAQILFLLILVASSLVLSGQGFVPSGMPLEPQNLIVTPVISPDQRCQPIQVLIDTIICDGGNFQGLTNPGIYYDTVQVGNNCDSITVIHLEVDGPVIIQIDTVICEGQSYNGFDSTGVFTYDSINPVTGCQDLVVLTLGIIPLGTGPCITGTGDVDEIELTIYPNPVRDEIFIEAPSGIESVRLLTLEGRVVSFKDNLNAGNKLSFPLQAGTVEGLYLLGVRVEGKEYVEKIVVSREK